MQWVFTNAGDKVIAILETKTAVMLPTSYFTLFPRRYIKIIKKRWNNREFVHCIMELPEKNERIKEKRICRAAGMLRDIGIREAITPEKFSYNHFFKRKGISIISCQYPYLISAAKISAAVIERIGIPFEHLTGVIYSDQVSRYVQDLAFELIKMTKFVKLDCGFGKEKLQKKLSKEYGVCTLKKAPDSHEFLICFSPPGEEYIKSSNAEVILDLTGRGILKEGSALYSGADFILPDRIEQSEFAGSFKQMITLLLQMEAIKPSELIVSKVI
ncbi:MAG: hypothetical protein N2Z65_03755 [Clostridiales bacterium]|nr:hypothetical protein [Clostridiales bacterium]